jgi:hypothetical protein
VAEAMIEFDLLIQLGATLDEALKGDLTLWRHIAFQKCYRD